MFRSLITAEVAAEAAGCQRRSTRCLVLVAGVLASLPITRCLVKTRP